MISVVIATFNGKKYILEQLNSIENQIIKPDEVIISDDCSTDDTLEIIKNFSVKSKLNIVVLNNSDRLGYGRNFERGLLHCKGEYIFFSDQDDVWMPNKISFMYNLATENPNLLCFLNNALIVDSYLKSLDNITKIGQIKKLGLSKKSFVMGACCLIRREILNITLPFPVHVKSHDNWIVEISNDLNLCYITEKVLQLYRRHGNNESNALFNSSKKISIFNKLDFIKKIKLNRINLSSKRITNLILKIDYLVSKKQTKLINILISSLSVELDFNFQRLQNLTKKNLFKLTKDLIHGNYNKFMSGFKSYLLDIL